MIHILRWNTLFKELKATLIRMTGCLSSNTVTFHGKSGSIKEENSYFQFIECLKAVLCWHFNVSEENK